MFQVPVHESLNTTLSEDNIIALGLTSDTKDEADLKRNFVYVHRYFVCILTVAMQML